jgi:hypothetical protein
MNIKQAEEFGRMMGKRAVALSPTMLSSLAGAAIGGGGTAIYDWLKGTKENKLRRAMIGAGLGGLAGAGLGHLAGKLIPASKPSDDEYRQAEQRVLEREVKKHLQGSPSSLPKSDDSSSNFWSRHRFREPTKAEMDDYYRKKYKNYYPDEPYPIDLNRIPEFEGLRYQSDLDDATTKQNRADFEHQRARADLARELRQKPPYYSEPLIIKARENIARTDAERSYYGHLVNQILDTSKYPNTYSRQKAGPYMNWGGEIALPPSSDGGSRRVIGKVTYKDFLE